MILIMAVTLTTVASAQPMKITGTVTDKVEKLDKNGNPFYRFIIRHTKKVDGSEYEDTSVFIAFADRMPAFEAVEVGQTITVIGDYGIQAATKRESYVLKTLLPTAE